jgi:hypothetical protein
VPRSIMIRRHLKNYGGDDLPMAVSMTPETRGDGRSIRVDAPFVRKVKQADTFTKATYIWLCLSLLSMWCGWRHCLYHVSSTVLSCDVMSCSLQDRAPKSRAFTKTIIPRSRVVNTALCCVDKQGKQLLQQHSSTSPGYQSLDYDCFKRKGFYSYTLVYEKDDRSIIEQENSYGNGNGNGHGHGGNAGSNSRTEHTPEQVTYVMRKFNLSKSRNRTEHNRLANYIQGKLDSVKVKHEQLITWQGMLMMSLGMTSFAFCALFGQFWDPSGPARHERQHHSQQQRRIRR